MLLYITGRDALTALSFLITLPLSAMILNTIWDSAGYPMDLEVLSSTPTFQRFKRLQYQKEPCAYCVCAFAFYSTGRKARFASLSSPIHCLQWVLKVSLFIVPYLSWARCSKRTTFSEFQTPPLQFSKGILNTIETCCSVCIIPAVI